MLVTLLTKTSQRARILPNSHKDFRALKAFRNSDVNPMSPLRHTWYINTHPHMHKTEAGERVRVSIHSNLLVCFLFCILCVVSNKV
jgi:hypothetical protein